MANYPTLIDKFCAFEASQPGQLFLSEPVAGSYKNFTWAEAGQQVRKMAAALNAMGLGKDDKVAILSKNCAHWIMADLAISFAGCVSVPMYPNMTPDSIQQILEHSEAKAIFFGKLDGADQMRKGVPEHLIVIGFPFYLEKNTQNWDDLIAEQQPVQGNPVKDPMALATIIYTSGTTGQPKGVMHNFHAVGFAVDKFLNHIHQIKKEIFFSYLPLCHVAEKMLVKCGAIFTGSTIYFVESQDTFNANLVHTQPTVFLAVPRIWEKMQEGVLSKMPQKKLSTLLSIPIISSIIKKAIKKKLGLSKARFIFTGASPISVALQEWFAKLDIIILEAYGMTENSALSHANRVGLHKFGTVGQSYTDVEVRLSAENEVQVKSEASMLGYFKEPQLTAESFEEGFLKTGDEGSIDEKGYLTITGRIKDQFKTSKGKYIMPAPIENKLLEHPLISQACVVGSGMSSPFVLCTLAPTAELPAGLDEELSGFLEQINKKLDHHERLSKVVICKEEWSIPNGLLTPTLKIKRKSIESYYGNNYDQWLKEDKKIIFVS
ncbi:MAG: AMP-binding protein [Bacteroidota bacterium]|jgi:long-chain acyl-CoA synthetase